MANDNPYRRNIATYLCNSRGVARKWHRLQAVMTGHNRYRVMSNKLNPETDPRQAMIYQIRLKGHLGRQWTDWFGGLTITLEEDGGTLLTGPAVDQAALYGLLRRVRGLGMPLLSINPA